MADRTFNFLIDDGGDNTDGLTWATAYTSLVSLFANEVEAAGMVIGIGHNHVDQNTYSANHVFTSPSSGITEPVVLISVTQGTGSIAGGGLVYQRATAKQIDTGKDGAYDITFSNNWDLQGIQASAGDDIIFDCNNDGRIRSIDSHYLPGSGGLINYNGSSGRLCSLNDEIDGSNDAGNSTNNIVTLTASIEIVDMLLSSVSTRTDDLFSFGAGTSMSIVGVDLSAATAGAGVDLFRANSTTCRASISNCKTPATYNLFTKVFRGGRFVVNNIGPGSQPEEYIIVDDYGDLYSTTGVTRTGGGSLEGSLVSFGGPTDGIQTSSGCTRGSPFYTEWMTVVIPTTGSKTITIFGVTDAAAYTKDEIWIELGYLADSSSGLLSFVSEEDPPDTVGTALATDTSTWVGAGPSFTNKFKLEKTVTVNTAGTLQVRVGIGVTSMASTDETHLDLVPVVT